MATLNAIYQVEGVKDLCRTCERWADKQLDEVRAANAPQVRARIEARLVRNKRPSLWRRIFSRSNVEISHARERRN